MRGAPNSVVLEFALRYAGEYGYNVFPCHSINVGGSCTCGNRSCRSPGKHPLSKLAPQGCLDATTDKGLIRSWWMQQRDANIGIATGQKSGIVVVDIDQGKGANYSELLVGEVSPLAFNTRKIATGAGLHFYYRYPIDATVGNSQNRLGKYIDVKSDGGYVIAPPSVHFSGRRYEILNDTTKLLDLPEEWIEKLCNDRAPSGGPPKASHFSKPTYSTSPQFECHEDRHEELVRRVKAVAKQNRHGKWDGKCPGHNGKGSTSLGMSSDGTAIWCNGNCDYWQILGGFGLPANQLRSRQSEVVPEPMRPPPFSGEPRALDRTLRPVEKIEYADLPPVLAKWLPPAAAVIGCPIDFLVLPAVAIAGSLIGSRLRLMPLENSDWSVVPNLYAGIVGLPSTKKTPALDEVRRPILQLQQESRVDYETRNEDFRLELKFYKKQEDTLLKKSGTKLAYVSQVKNLVKPAEPTMRRYETNDTTTPMLVEYLAENPTGLIQFRDELVGWLNSFDNEYERSARAFFLEL